MKQTMDGNKNRINTAEEKVSEIERLGNRNNLK